MPASPSAHSPSPRARYSAPLNVFSGFYDRYVTEGYADPTSLDRQLAAAVKVPGLAGVELVGRSNVDDERLTEVRRRLSETHLQVTTIIADLWGRRQWQNGSLAAPDQKIRALARDEIRKSMDWAAELGCSTVSTWFGQDGYDYVFQADYTAAWKRLIEGMSECADHNPSIRLAIEYKIKEPRTHCFVGTVGNTLLLVQACGKRNIGGMVDIGHALNAYENPAESVALLDHFGGKLFYLHLNDNWRLWDDDLMVGAVHLPEYVEFLYWLRRVRYDGWYAFDVYPYREDPSLVISESIRWTDECIGLLDSMGDEAIGAILETGKGGEGIRLLRRALFPGRAE